MYMPTVEFHEASSLDDAAGLLRRYGTEARLLAGGTDLLVDLKAGRQAAQHIIFIGRLAGMRRIVMSDDSLHVGALATITEFDESPEVRECFPAIRDATRCLAVRQIRNLATVGGNIATAAPCADLPPILITLGASVDLWSPAGVRSVPLQSFFVGARQTRRRTDEVLTAVVVPKTEPGFGAAYARFGLREGNAIAVAAVSAGFSLQPDGTIGQPRIVLGAVAPIPKMASGACAVLEGSRPGNDSFADAARMAREEAEPISDVRGSAAFRRELVEVLTRRALQAAFERIQGVDT